MAFDVEIMPQALQDAEEYVAFIRSQSHDELAATSWWFGLLEAARNLSEMPKRCPFVPEDVKFHGRYHQLLYHSHRIIFRVNKTTVEVLRIYHAVARPLTNLRQFPTPKKPRRS